MEDDGKYLQNISNLDEKYSTPTNCHIVDDPSIIKSYNTTASNNSTRTSPTLSQLTTSTTILNPASVGCHIDRDSCDSIATTVIKNEDVSTHYVLPSFLH
jgi:hypothetical protein